MIISRKTCLHHHHRIALLLFVCLALVTTFSTVLANGGSISSEDNRVPSLSEMDIYDALAIGFIVIGLTVSSAGGLGGGVFIVPSMVLIMGFDIKRATPISNVAILGGAVANAWYNMRKRHPTADRPLIDPELALGMIPIVIGGTILGAVIHRLIPSYVLSLLFIVVLALSGARTLMKGIRMHKKEVAKEKNADETSNEIITDAPISPNVYVPISTPLKVSMSWETRGSVSILSVNDAGSTVALSQILEKERHFAWGPHVAIMVCYLGILAISIGSAIVDCGSIVYWLLLMFDIPWVVTFIVITSHYLHNVYLRKAAMNYQYVEGDIRWTKKMVVFFPLGCLFSGIAASMFGVGGGIIASPIMVELNIVPEVASSTISFMILYSSAAATAQFAAFKMIAWDWAMLLCAVSLVVTSISQVVILGFVRRTGRQSIIVLCIAATTLIGGMIMAYQGIKSTINSAGEPFSAHICN